MNDKWDFKKEQEYEQWCLNHRPLIFNRVVWTHVIGKPFDEYDTCYIYQKIQLSYLSKAIRAIKKLFMDDADYIQSLNKGYYEL
jgi:hypothetical protein